MPQPPNCPHCHEHPLLWKDMTTASYLRPNDWRWHCAACKREWIPTSEQKLRYA